MADEGLQHIVHECLKCYRCISEAKGHDEELKVTSVRPKGGLGDVIRMHAHLMVPAAQVDLGEELGTLQFVQELINHWYWKFVLHDGVVEGTVVDAETPTIVVHMD